MEDEIVIDLREIFYAVKKNIVLVLVIGLLGGVLGFVMQKENAPKPVYQGEITFIVRNTTKELGTIVNNDINASQNLATSGAYVVENELLLNKIIRRLDLDLSYDELASIIEAERVAGTQVIKVVMTYNDSEVIASVLEQIGIYLPNTFQKTMGGGSCERLGGVTISFDETYEPTSGKSGAIIGAFLGAFFVLMLVVLKELLDDTVKYENQFVEKIGVPVLGMIPEIKE